MLTRRRTQRGLGLLDALISLLILSFGLLAVTRFQARLLAQGSEAQVRLIATQQADELLSMAVLDPTSGGVTNGPCYAVPTAAGCGNPLASAQATAWAVRAMAALPPGATATASWDGATSRLTATLNWTGKAVQEGVDEEDHQLSVTTDVR